MEEILIGEPVAAAAPVNVTEALMAREQRFSFVLQTGLEPSSIEIHSAVLWIVYDNPVLGGPISVQDETTVTLFANEREVSFGLPSLSHLTEDSKLNFTAYFRIQTILYINRIVTSKRSFDPLNPPSVVIDDFLQLPGQSRFLENDLATYIDFETPHVLYVPEEKGLSTTTLILIVVFSSIAGAIVIAQIVICATRDWKESILFKGKTE